MPRALLSVSDKTGLVDLARGLVDHGYEIVSTGGTARALTDAGLAVINVSDVTGFPEMMDGRVKTLHPKIHAGILARRDHSGDVAAAHAHGIELVEVVVVNLYPFAETAKKAGVAFDELIEQIDIGGPSLVRAAAKNFRDVLVVVDPRRYPDVLHELDRPSGPSLEFRFALAQDAIAYTGQYDTAIASALARFSIDRGQFVRSDSGSSAGSAGRIDLSLEKIRDLRYGENPHQRAAWYQIAQNGARGSISILQGKELSYTNLLDLDAAARIALEFTEPAAVVVKHTNPCGAATGASAADAYVRARDADPLAAFGGIVAVNRAIDAAAAEAIVSTFIEAVVAPDVEEAARPVLARKTNVRDRRGSDEPCRRGARRGGEGPCGERVVDRIGCGVRRVLSVPRRAGRGGPRRRDGRRPAGRIRPRRRGHPGGRRARPRDGVHGPKAFQALRGFMTQKDAWWWALLGVIVFGIAAHAFFPRYEWRASDASGSALVIYDRWSGRFQRGVYDADGKVKAMQVFTPF